MNDSPGFSPRGRDRGRISFASVIALAVSALAVQPTAANDRVHVQYPEKAGEVILVGEIDDFVGDRLTIRLRTSGPETVPASQILHIDTYYNPAHREGLALLDQGDVAAARAALVTALKEEHRKWVDREILAALIRCDLRTESLLAAGETFASLLDADPETRHWSTAPLVWSPVAVGIPLQSRARQWMSDPRPGMQLVAASILLLDPVYGDVARRSMEELARTPQPPVAALARAQLWRTRLGGQALSEKELQSWRTEIEYLPAWLRAGPQYLLGRGYLSRSLPRDAVTEWLWLGTSYKHLETLSVRALTEAAEALREAASESEADAVTALLRREFPWAAGSVAGGAVSSQAP